VANTISYLIQLRDRFSGAAKGVSKATRKMADDVKGLNRSLDGTQQKLKNTAKGIKDFAKGTAIGVSAPAAGFTVAAISAFNEQEKALAKVRSGLISTNNAVGISFEELQKQASALQEKSLFGDEEILGKATSTLITFTQITGDSFSQAQQAVVNLAAKMDGDLQGAAVMVGKALNDPVANLSALGRSGIQFNDIQKQTIKRLAQSGRMAEAQAIILKELETQFGGTAEEIAKMGAGPLKSLMMAIGDSSEEIGKLQFEMLRPLIETVKELNKKFTELSPGVKKLIAGAILLATVLGPVLLGLAAIAFIAGMVSAPLLIIVAAVGAVVAAGLWMWSEWDNIIGGMKALVADIGEWIRWDDIVGGFKLLVADLKTIWDDFAGWFLGVWDKLGGIVSKVANFLGFGGDNGVTVKQRYYNPRYESAPVERGGGTLNGQIVVSAEQGSTVQAAQMQSKGPGLDIGMNVGDASGYRNPRY
jgi:hypothetical protein